MIHFTVRIWASEDNGWGRIVEGQREGQINSVTHPSYAGYIEVPIVHRGEFDPVSEAVWNPTDPTAHALVGFRIYTAGLYEIEIKRCDFFSSDNANGEKVCIDNSGEADRLASSVVLATGSEAHSEIVANFIDSNVTFPAIRACMDVCWPLLSITKPSLAWPIIGRE